MILALQWMISALFGAAFLAVLALVAKRLSAGPQRAEDERKIRKAFETGACKVLSVRPCRRYFVMNRNEHIHTYSVSGAASTRVVAGRHATDR